MAFRAWLAPALSMTWIKEETDAGAPVGDPWFGDAVVDRARGRRRAGRPGGPVPGLSDRYRPVAEHGQGLRPRPERLLGLHRLPGPGLAGGPAGGRRGV